MAKTIHYNDGCVWSGGMYHFDTQQTNDWSKVTCKHCLRRNPTQRPPDVLQAHDMGEVNGVKLTYVNGNVFATPAKRR